jgi:hypothetical protein
MEGVVMRNLVLGGLLAVTSATAVLYVIVNPTPRSCSVRIEEPKPAEVTAPTATEEPSCPKCKSNVVDVVDLNTAYPVGPQTGGNAISFDEPPYAKPRAQGLVPTKFEMPLSEEAPAPRDAAELAPSPRLAK